jgi:hypothetical protein
LRQNGLIKACLEADDNDDDDDDDEYTESIRISSVPRTHRIHLSILTESSQCYGLFTDALSSV